MVPDLPAVCTSGRVGVWGGDGGSAHMPRGVGAVERDGGLSEGVSTVGAGVSKPCVYWLICIPSFCA